MIESVCYLDDISQEKSASIAKRLHTRLVSSLENTPQLLVTNNQLSLRIPALGNPISIDFLSGKYDHRRKFGGGKGQPLAKAVGLKQSPLPSVIDATAGFARDSFVLASLGCKVRLLEQNPILSLLIKDAIEQAQADVDISDIAYRMESIHSNSIDYLTRLQIENYPDVIYMDPMYPSREKSALVKKEMQLLHQMVGPDTDSANLLKLALLKAKKRVVIKRPKGAEYVNQLKPTMSIQSKNTRYDVYVTL